MHYIITDIHNDSWRFMKLLEKIDLKEDDHLYLLGDLFDRCMDHPDPAGVYFQVLKLGKKMYCDPRQPRSLACQLHFPLLRDG